MYSAIVNLIGSVPEGFEPILYIFVLLFTMEMLNLFAAAFFEFFSRWR